jgi:transcription elongation factor Elf1
VILETVVVQMGRRRRKVIKRVQRRIPSLFTCPSCGNRSVRIALDRDHNEASVKCGICGINVKLGISRLSEQEDVYGKFIDMYYSSK